MCETSANLRSLCMLPRRCPRPGGQGWGSASPQGPCQAGSLHAGVRRHCPCPAFHPGGGCLGLSSAKGRGCSLLCEINPFFPVLSLYVCCLENRATTKGKAGVQTTLTASLCPGPCTLGLQGDIKRIHSEPSGKSFSLSGSPATLEGWDPNLYPSRNACVRMGSLSWSLALLSVHILPSAFPLLRAGRPSLARPTPSTVLRLLWWVSGSKLHITNSLPPWEYTALSRPGGWRAACQGCS